jgi:hemerythrin-like metal-binding protein
MSQKWPLAPIAIQAWHAGLTVGNALLDKQHIVLFELIRSLCDPRGALDDDAFTQALADIAALSERHFAAEEQLLALNGYEWLEQHLEEHVAGLDRIHSILIRHTGGHISRESACAAVATWYEAHLLEMDLPAQGYLRSSFGSSDRALPREVERIPSLFEPTERMPSGSLL